MTGEDRDRVEPFVEEFGANFPIMCQAQSGAYSTGGVPSAYLIGADGTVVWQGHPGNLQDSEIEGHLKDVKKADRVSTWAFTIVKQLPPVPDKLKGVKKSLEKMKFGAALKTVEAALPKLEGEDLEAGEAIRDWIAGNGKTSMDKAATLVRENKIYDAFLVYEGVEDRFKGHQLGKDAKAAAKELKSGKETGLEIKASEKLIKAKKEMRGEKKFEDQLKCLKPVLSKKYAETAAGKEAAKMAEDIEAKLK